MYEGVRMTCPFQVFEILLPIIFITSLLFDTYLNTLAKISPHCVQQYVCLYLFYPSKNGRHLCVFATIKMAALTQTDELQENGLCTISGFAI